MSTRPWSRRASASWARAPPIRLRLRDADAANRRLRRRIIKAGPRERLTVRIVNTPSPRLRLPNNGDIDLIISGVAHQRPSQAVLRFHGALLRSAPADRGARNSAARACRISPARRSARHRKHRRRRGLAGVRKTSATSPLRHDAVIITELVAFGVEGHWRQPGDAYRLQREPQTVDDRVSRRSIGIVVSRVTARYAQLNAGLPVSSPMHLRAGLPHMVQGRAAVLRSVTTV